MSVFREIGFPIKDKPATAVPSVVQRFKGVKLCPDRHGTVPGPHATTGIGDTGHHNNFATHESPLSNTFFHPFAEKVGTSYFRPLFKDVAKNWTSSVQREGNTQN
jgi:hypothetical protein